MYFIDVTRILNDSFDKVCPATALSDVPLHQCQNDFISIILQKKLRMFDFPRALFPKKCIGTRAEDTSADICGCSFVRRIYTRVQSFKCKICDQVF
jgi:hypothetical protein